MYIVLLAWSARLLELPQTRQSALLGEQALSTLVLRGSYHFSSADNLHSVSDSHSDSIHSG